MAEGLYTALSGAVAQEQALEVIANNLANVSTQGFKGDSVQFKEVLAQNHTDAQNAHVQVAEVFHDFSQGTLKNTQGRMDLALRGDGFFVVEGPQGEMLTRNGAFTLRGDGYIQNADGMLVQGQNGAMRVDPGARVRFDSFGSLFVTPPGIGASPMGETMQDRVRVVNVDDPQKLQRAGHGLWDLGGAQPVRGNTPIEVGALEQSNVNAISMMTKLIQVQRAYESYNRSIQQIHGTEQKAASQLG